MRPAIMPPLPTEKFQPIYSPTSTMPTPSAQTCAGPSTRSNCSLWGCSAAAVVTFAIVLSPSDHVPFRCRLDLAFARGGQQVVVIGRIDADEVRKHEPAENEGERPGRVFEKIPDIHSTLPSASARNARR